MDLDNNCQSPDGYFGNGDRTPRIKLAETPKIKVFVYLHTKRGQKLPI